MKTAIVFAHPWHGSFNKAILDTVVTSLTAKKKEFVLLDLNKDNFNPVMKEQDLALFSQGDTSDQQVKEYQAILKDSDEIVFIFPIWWFGMPAILKGFIDKVMLKTYAYNLGKLGLVGLLGNIQKTTVITTSEMPTIMLRFGFGNPIAGTFKAILKGVGFKNIKWYNSDFTTSGKRSKKTKFLNKIKKRF